MKRQNTIDKITANQNWDLIIIGGGATGLGTAIDAASRGLKTLLLEASDFAKGTSSRSTKLVHGGVRYLQQGDVFLVMEALKERGLMKKNAPHLVEDLQFVIPIYSYFDLALYTIGLKFYDLLSGKLSFGKSEIISKSNALQLLPNVKQSKLKGAVLYHDGQFNDSRMAISMMQSAQDLGADLLNYFRVESFVKSKGKIVGVNAKDILKGENYTINAKSFINATGVWVEDLIKLDTKTSRLRVRPSQGVHLVVDSSFLKSDKALMIPKTSDSRVLFAIPWNQKLIIGTTDTLVSQNSYEPQALKEEIDFIISNFNDYNSSDISYSDIKSVFTGLRPLASSKNPKSQKTKEISRRHKIISSRSGLISITGGKWTTYRIMAEEVVDLLVRKFRFKVSKSRTQSLLLHGAKEFNSKSEFDYYGSDLDKIEELISSSNYFSELIHPQYNLRIAHVVWAIREEHCVCIEDFLARRCRLLFIDVKAAIECSAKVASVFKDELQKDDDWCHREVEEFKLLADKYLLVNFNS